MLAELVEGKTRRKLIVLEGQKTKMQTVFYPFKTIINLKITRYSEFLIVVLQDILQQLYHQSDQQLIADLLDPILHTF